MSREPILSADDVAPAAAERSRYAALTREDDLALRPQRMEDMVGQRAVYERLKIAVDAARIRSEPLGHILLDGPPGLGKTTFATCIPRALDVPLQLRRHATGVGVTVLALTFAAAGSVWLTMWRRRRRARLRLVPSGEVCAKGWSRRRRWGQRRGHRPTGRPQLENSARFSLQTALHGGAWRTRAR